jgi:hypothetical protein
MDYGDKFYDRLQRRINAVQRNYRVALKDLQTLPAATEVGQALPPASPEPESVQQLTSEIGFVPEKVYRNLWTPSQDRKVS